MQRLNFESGGAPLIVLYRHSLHAQSTKVSSPDSCHVFLCRHNVSNPCGSPYVVTPITPRRLLLPGGLLHHIPSGSNSITTKLLNRFHTFKLLTLKQLFYTCITISPLVYFALSNLCKPNFYTIAAFQPCFPPNLVPTTNRYPMNTQTLQTSRPHHSPICVCPNNR